MLGGHGTNNIILHGNVTTLVVFTTLPMHGHGTNGARFHGGIRSPTPFPFGARLCMVSIKRIMLGWLFGKGTSNIILGGFVNLSGSLCTFGGHGTSNFMLVGCSKPRCSFGNIDYPCAVILQITSCWIVAGSIPILSWLHETLLLL